MTEQTMQERNSATAMMEIYQKLATPGAQHALLAKMEGSWKTRTMSWMTPDQPPVSSEGICQQKMILDGRFLQQEFTGDMMGAPFIGIGINGYDNHQQKFVSIWMDTMGTGIYFFEGSADIEGNAITQQCQYDDPVRGPMIWRSVTRFVDDNTHTFEMYSIDQSGKEEKMMEMTYIRK